MRRSVVIAFVVLGLILVALAIALASVGTQFDEVRIDRNNLNEEVMTLEEEVDTLTGERDQLKTQVDEHLKAIEQLKAQLDGSRTTAQAAPAATTSDTNTP